MRGAAQITRTPREWHDHQEEERRQAATEFHRLTAAARARGEAWIGWIDAGCPLLTEAEYEAQGGRHARATSSSPRAASEPTLL